MRPVGNWDGRRPAQHGVCSQRGTQHSGRAATHLSQHPRCLQIVPLVMSHPMLMAPHISSWQQGRLPTLDRPGAKPKC